MHRMVKKLLLLFIFIAPKLEKLFGLSEFRYKNKRIKVFTLYSRVIVILFIILYPFSCIRTLKFFQTSDSDVTIYARNITFGSNWLLLVFIYANETFNEEYYQGFESIKPLFRKLIKLQNFKQNLVLLLCCTVKVSVVFVIILKVNFAKYYHNRKPKMTEWERVSMILLFLPFVILSLASNRIYVANTIVKQYLMMYVKDLKSPTTHKALKIQLFAIKYQNLQEFFTRFNKSNAINFLVILSFYLLNIVYEVNIYVDLINSHLILMSLQAYFFYLYMSQRSKNKSSIIVIACIVQVVSYLTELILTIVLYDKIKAISSSFYYEDDCSSQYNGNQVRWLGF